MHTLWFASFSHFVISPCAFLFCLSLGLLLSTFLPCPFACEILLQAMIHYCPLMAYLQVGISENMVVEFEG